MRTERKRGKVSVAATSVNPAFLTRCLMAELRYAGADESTT